MSEDASRRVLFSVHAILFFIRCPQHPAFAQSTLRWSGFSSHLWRSKAIRASTLELLSGSMSRRYGRAHPHARHRQPVNDFVATQTSSRALHSFMDPFIGIGGCFPFLGASSRSSSAATRFGFNFLSGSLLFVCAYAASVLFREVMWRIVTMEKAHGRPCFLLLPGPLVLRR